MDILSDVLRAVRLSGALFFDIRASAPWVGASPSTADIAAAVMPGVEHVISFHAVISGSCWAALDNDPAPPIRMNSGDVVIFPGGAPNVMSSSPGGTGEPNMGIYHKPADIEQLPYQLIHGGGGDVQTRFICGYLGCDSRPSNPLLSALPPIFAVRKPPDQESWIVDLFGHALGNKRAGNQTILAKLSELMFVEAIRCYIESLPAHSLGWLSGLRDRHVAKALQLIHGRPSENWTIDLLAREAGLSRTAFSERFVHFVEVPPMYYLVQWRMQVASRLLEERGMSIAQVGSAVGYESEAAFSC
ncbi:MAG: AraC family transcriptional regulator [Shinella sp.]|uniref:AraC family transcriptional regulator n=1 Tax=Shinella sp. TaxID=1870904 RepID=UPI004036F26B